MEDIMKEKFTMEIRSNWIAFLGHLMMDEWKTMKNLFMFINLQILYI